MTTVKKYCLILCALLLLYTSAIAQKCDIVFYGTVRDGITRQVLPGASISIVNTSKQAPADQEGHFHFNKICSGDYRVEVSFIGYGKKSFSINIQKNTELDVFLFEDKNELAEIQIVSNNSHEPVYTAQKLSDREYELSKGKTLGEVLNSIPGVTTIHTGPTISKPVIHGMHSNRILIYNAGVRLEGQQWGNEHAPEIDPFLAKDITVVKGAAGVEYGSDALGGIVLMTPAELNYHLPLSYEVDLLGASNSRMGLFSGKIEGNMLNESLAWRVQGTVKKAGNASAPDYFLNNTGAEELNGSLTLGYKKKTFDAELFISTFNTKLGILKDAHIGGEDDLQYMIEHGRPFSDGNFSYKIDVPSQEVHHHTIRLKGKKFLSNNGILSFSYSFQNNQRQEYDLRRGGRSNLPTLDLDLNAQNLEVAYQKSQSQDAYTKFGINTAVIVSNSIPGTSMTPLIPNYDSFNPSLFFIKKLKLNNTVLETGIRYDYKTIDAAGYDAQEVWYGGKHNFHNASFSLGSLFRLKPDLNFKSDFNFAWRPPSINELYSNGLHHGNASFEIGDKNLNSEKGYKWINTLSLNKKAWQVELSGYFNYVDNYIYLQPSGEYVVDWGIKFLKFYYTQTNARFIGSDLSSLYSISKHFDWQLKASMVRAKDVSNDSYLPFIPTDRVNNSIIWKINLQSTKISQPYLTIEHSFVAKQHRHQENRDFALPPASYHLFNLSGGMNYKLKENTLGISASVFNLFNTNYKDYLNRFRYFTYETGRNLVVRLSYKF